MSKDKNDSKDSSIRGKIITHAVLAVFVLSYLTRDFSLLAFVSVLVVLVFEESSFFLMAVFHSVSYLVTIKASLLFHVFLSFFDSHFVNIHCVWVSSCVCISWHEHFLWLIVARGSSVLSKDFSNSLILCIIS